MTIGMNNLGKNGRMGNQMFQYAALVGIAKQCGFDFRIPDQSKAPYFNRKVGANIITEYHELQHCFEMLHCGDRYGLIDGDEIELHESHEFCEELFKECPNHVTLNGYFQSEKYFKNAEKLLRLDFRFKEHIIEEVEDHFSSYLNEEPVCILVRDFNPDYDYPNCENNHINIPPEFYEKSIDILGRDRMYIICSNNIELTKKQEVFQGDNFIFNEVVPTDIYKGHFDLCLMSMCQDFIISNSTFAWWGAWLGDGIGKRVLIPTPWYGPGLSHINTDDLYPDEWEKIEWK